MTAISTAEARRPTAYHEAGHLAVALYQGRVPDGATIKAGANSTGETFWSRCTGDLPELRTWQRRVRRGEAEMVLREQLGGLAIELHRQCPEAWAGAIWDLRNARIGLAFMHGDPKRVEAELQRLLDETLDIVERPEVLAAIDLIAGELMRRETLRGEEFWRIAAEAMRLIRGADAPGYGALVKTALAPEIEANSWIAPCCIGLSCVGWLLVWLLSGSPPWRQ